MSTEWIGVCGALAGVLLGGGLTMWHEHRRWSREDLIRWQNERREAYRRFLRAVSEFPETSSAKTASERETARGQMAEALQDIDLIGSYRIQALARFMYHGLTGQRRDQTIERDGTLTTLLSDSPPYGGRDAHEQIQTARFFLIETAREELRIEDAGVMARAIQSIHKMSLSRPK